MLIAALSLWVSGCTSLQPDTTADSIPPPTTEIKGAQEVASAPTPPEAPSKPTPPAPQQPQRVSEPKRAPATASKGAEKLVVSSAPFPVRAREKTLVKAEPAELKAPAIAGSGAVTDAPVAELICRGPPQQLRPRLSAKKLLPWFGLGLGVAALGVVARLCLIPRAEPIKVPAAKAEDLIDAPGLLLKESVNALPAAMATEKNC